MHPAVLAQFLIIPILVTLRQVTLRPINLLYYVHHISPSV